MRDWGKVLLAAVGVAGFVYGLTAVDVVLRARTAYLEGEKYMRWQDHPDEKKRYFDAAFDVKSAGLKKELEAGRLTKAEFDERLELAGFERDQSISESSVKYAYVWFQTAAELFTPPESRWIAKSRSRMADAKKLWQTELRAKGIPFEDYMFE
jgi:hypothetical protein